MLFFLYWCYFLVLVLFSCIGVIFLYWSYFLVLELFSCIGVICLFCLFMFVLVLFLYIGVILCELFVCIDVISLFCLFMFVLVLFVCWAFVSLYLLLFKEFRKKNSHKLKFKSQIKKLSHNYVQFVRMKKWLLKKEV